MQKKLLKLLKKFNLLEAKVLYTSMTTSKRLDNDENRVKVNQTMYRGIIRSLIYLNSRRPIIVLSVRIC